MKKEKHHHHNNNKKIFPSCNLPYSWIGERVSLWQAPEGYKALQTMVRYHGPDGSQYKSL